MTKTYLISEEVLREVLGALLDQRFGDAHTAINTILSNPPSEPHSWVQKTKEEMAKDNRSFMQPLYTKDA